MFINEETTTAEVLHRYRRLASHLICHSLGYLSPTAAGNMIKDVALGKSNWCEWIMACGGPKTPAGPPGESAISTRLERSMRSS